MNVVCYNDVSEFIFVFIIVIVNFNRPLMNLLYFDIYFGSFIVFSNEDVAHSEKGHVKLNCECFPPVMLNIMCRTEYAMEY